jgi:hypothetical protein
MDGETDGEIRAESPGRMRGEMQDDGRREEEDEDEQEEKWTGGRK